MITQPFLKWCGGKRQLLDRLLPLLPEDTAACPYIEPMVGGGALFFRLGHRNATIADTNIDLMNAYAMVRDRLETLISLLRGLDEKHIADAPVTYYEIRDAFNAEINRLGPLQAARLIYLNRTCFNGLYRVNKKGAFNTPMGSYATPDIVREGSLRTTSKALVGVSLRTSPFTRVPSYAEPGSVIYFDPPYQPISSSSSFTSFTAGGFNEENQRELARVVEDLVEKGCKVLLTNSDHPLIHGLYREFPRVRLLARRSINSVGSKRGPVTELAVLTGYDPPQGVEYLTGSGTTLLIKGKPKPIPSEFPTLTTTRSPKLTVLNFSGGKQSSALLWMVLRGELPRPKHFIVLTANPGMENSLTYKYVDMMFVRCREAGIEAFRAPGPNLYEDMVALAQSDKTRLDNPPYWTKNPKTGKLGQLMQKCTRHYKIAPMDRLIRGYMEERFEISRKSSRLGENTVEKWIGLSASEEIRVKPSNRKYIYFRYPLIELDMRNSDVVNYYKTNGLPMPPRSVCNACFANGLDTLREMHANRPGDWAQAVKIDNAVRDLSQIGIEEPTFVSKILRPLQELAEDNFGKHKNDIDGSAWSCDSGYCFT